MSVQRELLFDTSCDGLDDDLTTLLCARFSPSVQAQARVSQPPPTAASQQRVMSSLQTMTAPPAAVGHRPPDPGIDIATSSTASHAAIVDNEVDQTQDDNNNFTSAVSSDDYAIAPLTQDQDQQPVMYSLPQDPPVEVRKEQPLENDSGRNSDTVVAEGAKIGEKESGEQVEREGEASVSVSASDNSLAKQEKENENENEPPEDADHRLQDQEKQSAATSLLAQLLGNVNARSAAPGTPEYVPRTPLAEPLTDVSTPVAPNEDPSLPLTNGQTDDTTQQTQVDLQNGLPVVSYQDEPTIPTEVLGLPTEQSADDAQDDSTSARIPDMVTGVMEDPLSKTSHDHNSIFAPFDADAAIKNGLDPLQQHDLLANAFLSQEINMSGLPDLTAYSTSYNDVAASIAGSEPRIQAFAKLEFDDGHFYVNTHSFILGRDVRAARAAFQREMQVRQTIRRPSKNKSSSGGNTSHTPNRVKRDGSAYVGSVVSDRGGIMGFDPDVPHHISQLSRRSSVSSQPDSVLHATPAQLQTNHTDYNALAMQSLYDGTGDAKPVDMLALLPSPEACPTIPIHPPATVDGSAAGHKGISRKHVKISYNFDKSFFEMEVMGRNGAFIGADWLAPGQVRPLHSGDYIQIGGVRIRFLLPDVPIGETGADRLEDALMGDDGMALTGDAAEEIAADVDAMDDSDLDSQDGTDKPRVTKLVLKTKAPSDSANADVSIDGNLDASQPKRRGPGRPPKDGIMSKRERAEIAREQKMAAKREANGGVTPPPPVNRPKPPKPRKEDSVEEPPAKPVEKKKFVKRKQPDGSIIDVPIESIEGGEQLPPEQLVEYPKPPPPKKRKPSRSPSPDYPPESSYTQEQLAKPPYNYAVLIFDALTESQTPMTLKQIYRALKLKYPYFRFKCETEGWTSSVRHNLNGNRQLFEHAERDGKGWSWQLRAGASVEKEKKRRPSPPPPTTHIPHQPPHQHYMPPTHSYSNQGLQNQQFQFSAMPSNSFNAPPPPPSNNYQRLPAPPAPTQPSIPAPFRNTNLPPALAQPAPSNYLSPYPCALPAEIIQLQQQANRPPPPQPAMDHQRQPDSVPPPQQHQLPQSQLQQQPQSHPAPPSQQQQQTHQQHQHSQPHQQHPPPSFTSYPPQANSQMHPYPPQPGQLPPSTSQQPSQTMHPPHQPQQAYQPPQQHQHQQHQQHPQQSQQQQQQQPPPPPPPSQPPSGPPMNNNNSSSSSSTMQEPESSMSFLERANKAIDDFEAVLMEDYEDKNYIREVLKSARARALGHADKSSFPDGEPKDEAVLLDVLRNLIGSLKDEQS